jgi:hypothetical protein
MNDFRRPNARSEGLVIQQLADETLVYDLNADEAHCLNETAAFVWTNCKGDKSIDEIARSVQMHYGQPVDADFVLLAVKQLDDKKLLTVSGLEGVAMPSRREAIKKIGLASAIAIPIVASLVAPSSALASTSCACVNPADCIVQTMCPSTVNCNSPGLCAP